MSVRHKVKVYFINSKKVPALPYGYDPIGKLGWRLGGGASIVDYSQESGWYEFECTEAAFTELINYIRGFAKHRSYEATKVEITFTTNDDAGDFD